MCVGLSLAIEHYPTTNLPDLTTDVNVQSLSVLKLGGMKKHKVALSHVVEPFASKCLDVGICAASTADGIAGIFGCTLVELLNHVQEVIEPIRQLVTSIRIDKDIGTKFKISNAATRTTNSNGLWR